MWWLVSCTSSTTRRLEMSSRRNPHSLQIFLGCVAVLLMLELWTLRICPNKRIVHHLRLFPTSDDESKCSQGNSMALLLMQLQAPLIIKVHVFLISCLTWKIVHSQYKHHVFFVDQELIIGDTCGFDSWMGLICIERTIRYRTFVRTEEQLKCCAGCIG
jgi:hypothetical protein